MGRKWILLFGWPAFSDKGVVVIGKSTAGTWHSQYIQILKYTLTLFPILAMAVAGMANIFSC